MTTHAKIVMLLPTARSEKDLYELSSALGLDTSIGYDGQPCNDFEFHMTLVCSRNAVEYPNFKYYLPQKITVNGFKVDILGDRATTLLTDTPPALKDIHDKTVSEMKLVHMHPSFLPHVSLSYVLKPELALPMPIWYPVTFDRMIIKDFTPDP